jgi:hypothetical protein
MLSTRQWDQCGGGPLSACRNYVRACAAEEVAFLDANAAQRAEDEALRDSWVQLFEGRGGEPSNAKPGRGVAGRGGGSLTVIEVGLAAATS